jgi:hypothetical protein
MGLGRQEGARPRSRTRGDGIHLLPGLGARIRGDDGLPNPRRALQSVWLRYIGCHYQNGLVFLLAPPSSFFLRCGALALYSLFVRIFQASPDDNGVRSIDGDAFYSLCFAREAGDGVEKRSS